MDEVPKVAEKMLSEEFQKFWILYREQILTNEYIRDSELKAGIIMRYFTEWFLSNLYSCVPLWLEIWEMQELENKKEESSLLLYSSEYEIENEMKGDGK